MPKLKIVAACEKTIIDRAGPVSLISIFQRMNIPLQDAPLPEKAISPMWWSAFTLWENDPKEVGLEFEQVLRIIVPDGSLWQEFRQVFKNENAEDTQTKINILVAGLPIWEEGEIEIRVSLGGDDAVLGSYRFAVAYLRRVQDAKAVEGTVP